MHSYQLHTSTHKQSTEPSEEQAKDPGTTDAQREALQKPKTTQTFGPRWAWRGRPPWRQQGRAAKGLSHPTQDASTLLDLGRKGSVKAGWTHACSAALPRPSPHLSLQPLQTPLVLPNLPQLLQCGVHPRKRDPRAPVQPPAEAAPPEASRGMQAHPRIPPLKSQPPTRESCPSQAPASLLGCAFQALRVTVPLVASLCQ